MEFSKQVEDSEMILGSINSAASLTGNILELQEFNPDSIAIERSSHLDGFDTIDNANTYFKPIDTSARKSF